MTVTNNIRYLYDTMNGVELILCNTCTISYPLHNHVSVFTIGMVLAGSILLNTGFDSHVYSKNQTFTLLPYMPHSIKANDKYTLLSLCIHKNVFQCNVNKMENAITNLLMRTIDSSKLSHRQILQLLNCLNAFRDNSLSWRQNAKNPLIDNLKQRLERSPEDKFSIEEMARAALISKYHFIRSFKQKIGLTPHQFQLQNRIRKAQRLMNQVDTIAEVALTTGFCDQSHFIRQFEKYVGLTPSNYKISSDVLHSDSAD